YDPRLRYHCFVDPSGGSSDSFTMAIAHREGKTAVLDLVREVKAPFSPEATVADFCKVLQTYRINEVTGDKYAAQWPIEQFAKFKVTYRQSEQTKSELYQAALPLLNSRLVALLDNTTAIRQFVGLERRTSRGGKDSIDHAPGAKDDVANAIAGALV